MTKKLSPMNITGVIINDGHKYEKIKTHEAFLTKLLKREHPKIWIKGVTGSAKEVARGGQPRIERLMKALQVNNIVLYPRIKAIIKEDLDNMKGF